MTESGAESGAEPRKACPLAGTEVLAGPMLRRVTRHQLVLWLVCTGPVAVRLKLVVDAEPEPVFNRTLAGAEVNRIRFGTHAYLYLLNIALDSPLPENVHIAYDLGLAATESGPTAWVGDWAPHLCLPGKRSPEFVLKVRVDRILHGSCRKVHHPAQDGLVQVDEQVLASQDRAEERPALLLLTGDQVYADDVSGPLLRAIHALIARLGLYDETLEGAVVSDSQKLYTHPDTYYHRECLLPQTPQNLAMTERFFGGVEKPVFTTDNAHNHLMSLAEVMAMYLLVWSPTPWGLIEVQPPALGEEEARKYQAHQVVIDHFVETLPQAARALAHLPTYMIFDDHDVTDDWNLSALWEETAYNRPFPRRIIGNALIGYALCQAWGNDPAALDSVIEPLARLLNGADEAGMLSKDSQDEAIDSLLAFRQWHYNLPTEPTIVVLDTRTRRWRSELSRSRPSGLMDWEALSEFQQDIMDLKSVIVVSPAPLFGVKLIETIQRMFTFIGKPLVVDAENWMAHRGAAQVILNIFGHSRTPQNFVILSGDVHYSFAYDIRLRHRKNSPRIWQITSSGIKNEFPQKLLKRLDLTNRWLYAPRSPLNWFTKRRRMEVASRIPEGCEKGERLWNRAGIGMVELDEQGVPVAIRELSAGGEGTRFLRSRL